MDISTTNALKELNTLSVYTNEFGKKSNEKSYEEWYEDDNDERRH